MTAAGAKLADLAAARLGELEAAGRLRRLRSFARRGGALVDADGRVLVDLSSNDYLGLARDPRLVARATEWAGRLGAGSCASRLVTGTLAGVAALEARLAVFKGTEAALLLNSGFQANATVLPALAELMGGAPLLFADRLNHASLHAGCRLAGLRQIRFRHNDLDHLAELLRRHEATPGPRLIVTESVFSMDGDRCDLAALADLADAHGAALYVDEAHATGVLGPEGRGLSATVPGRVDLVMGTLGKALGGFGAYVAGSRRLIDFLVNRCSGLIYSTALPPAALGALDAALDLVPAMTAQRAHLAALGDRLRAGLAGLGIASGNSTTQIVPALLGAEQTALDASSWLESQGFLAAAIRPPTVPDGGSRLRLALNAGLDASAVDRLLAALAARP